VILGQDAGAQRVQAAKDFLFAKGLEDDVQRIGLELTHFAAQGGATVEQAQKLFIQTVDLAADFGQALRGRTHSLISSVMRMPKCRPA
jgi:hypothetical protein